MINVRTYNILECREPEGFWGLVFARHKLAACLTAIVVMVIGMTPIPAIAIESPPEFELMWGSGVNTGVSGPEICSAATIPCFAGLIGNGAGEFNRPSGIAVSDSGRVYMSEHFGHRVNVFDLDGNFITNWATGGVEPGDMDFDSNGNVYVVLHNAHRIQVYDADGLPLWGFGSLGSSEGQFRYPTGITLDSDGNIYVAERNQRIQKFDQSGSFISMWGWGVQTGAAQFEICTSNCLPGLPGSGDGQLRDPGIIDIDSEGNLYVVDVNNNRVQVFDSTGNFLFKWGSFGTGDGQFNLPNGVRIAADGSVFVVEASGNRIQKFTSDGGFLMQWGAPGSGPGEFSTPVAIAIGPSNELFVTEHFQHRIQKFVPATPPFACVGFEPPLNAGPVKVKKKRALPLKVQLFNGDGIPVTDELLIAPPVLQVVYSPAAGGEPVDVTDDALAVGLGSEGNQFELNIDVWQYNLKTNNYTAPGTYTITVITGDSYVINPSCQASFIIK